MSIRAVFAFSGLLFVSGCLYHAREHTDTTVSEIVGHPYDTAPVPPAPAPPQAPPATGDKQSANTTTPQTDIQTTAYMSEAAVSELAPGQKAKIEPRASRRRFRAPKAPGFHLPDQPEGASAPSSNCFPLCRP